MEIPFIWLLILEQVLEPVTAMLDLGDDDMKSTTFSIVSGLADNTSASVEHSMPTRTTILKPSHNIADSSTLILLSTSAPKVSIVTTFPTTTGITLEQDTQVPTASELQKESFRSDISSSNLLGIWSPIDTSSESSSFHIQETLTTVIGQHAAIGPNQIDDSRPTSTDYLSPTYAQNNSECQPYDRCPSLEPWLSDIVSQSRADATAIESQCENAFDVNEIPTGPLITTREGFPTYLTTYDINTVVGTKTYSIGDIETLIETDVIPVTATRTDYQRSSCFECYIWYLGVDVFYFLPAEWANRSSCVSDPIAKGKSMTSSARGLNRQLTGSTVINEDGFTFTSPSVYVRFGTVFAEVMNGQPGHAYLGDTYTSLILPFAPQELYTETYLDSAVIGEGFTEYPFDVHDVTCSESIDIVFPTKLRYAIPAWSFCSSGGVLAFTLAPGFLTTAVALIGPGFGDTKTTDPVSVGSPPPVPASTTPHVFQPTKLPSEWISDDQISKPTESEDDKTPFGSDSSQIKPVHSDPHPNESSRPPNILETQLLASSLNHNIADLIASALGISPKDISPISNPDRNGGRPPDASPAPPTLPLISLLNPTRLLIGSMTLTPSAKPVTINGHIIEFQLTSASVGAVPSPAIIVDSSTLDMNRLTNGINLAAASGNPGRGEDATEPPTASKSLPPGVSVLDPSRVIVDGITITRGATPTTLAGGEVVIWEGNADEEKLVVGGTTIDIDAIAAAALVTGAAALPRLITLSSGETLTSGGAAVTNAAGHTLSYGAAGLVVDGKTVSLPVGTAAIGWTGAELTGDVSQTGAATDGVAIGNGRKEVQIDYRSVVMWLLMWLGPL